MFEAFINYRGTARNLWTSLHSRIAIDNCTNFHSLFPVLTDSQVKTSRALITTNLKVDDAGYINAESLLHTTLICSSNRRTMNLRTARRIHLKRSSRLLLLVSCWHYIRLFEGRGHSYLFNSLKSPLNIRPLSTDGQPVSVNSNQVESSMF